MGVSPPTSSTEGQYIVTTFYGVELATPCSRPPDVSEIMSMADEIQEWILEQLTTWVRENGGELSLLLAESTSQWMKTVIATTWHQTTTDPAEIARQLHVGLQ